MSTKPVAASISELPPEMLDFTLLKTTGVLAPRLGRLSVPGRKSILTPGFIGNTSRGVIPHISQDNFRKIVNLNGVYVALEDCTCQMPKSLPHCIDAVQMLKNIPKKRLRYSRSRLPIPFAVSLHSLKTP